MFIKFNGCTFNSVSIRRTSIEPGLPEVDDHSLAWRIYAHLTTDDRALLGEFRSRPEAQMVIDEYIYPALRDDVCLDLDAVYKTYGIGYYKGGK